MSYVKHKEQAYYLARLDAAIGLHKERDYFQSEADWELYKQTRRETKLSYGYRYLLPDLRHDAEAAVRYEAGERAHFTCYKMGERVASAQCETPHETFLEGLTAEQKAVYYLGYRKGVAVTRHGEFFQALLDEFSSPLKRVQQSCLDSRT